MDDFLKMDIFFLVTTAIVLVGGVFVVAILYYLVRVMKNVDRIMTNVRLESEAVRGDIAVLRKKLSEEGMRLKHFSEFFDEVILKRSPSRKKRSGSESH